MASENRVPYKLIIVLILIAILITFVIQNRAQAEVHLLFLTLRTSGAVMLILTFLIGVAVGILSAMTANRGRQVKVKTPPPPAT